MSEGGGGEPFALRVLGDRMAPEFAGGAFIVIDPNGVVSDGAYVFAQHGGEYIFRRLQIRDGRWRRLALNRGYPALDVTGHDAIKGVVVQRAGTRRSEHRHYG